MCSCSRITCLFTTVAYNYYSIPFTQQTLLHLTSSSFLNSNSIQIPALISCRHFRNNSEGMCAVVEILEDQQIKFFCDGIAQLRIVGVSALMTRGTTLKNSEKLCCFSLLLSKAQNFLTEPYIYIYIYIYVCVCVHYIYIYIYIYTQTLRHESIWQKVNLWSRLKLIFFFQDLLPYQSKRNQSALFTHSLGRRRDW